MFANEDGVTVVTLNRPEKMNAVTHAMREALLKFVLDADRDPAVGAIVLEGAGARAFCAGADLSELGTRTWKTELEDERAGLRRSLPRAMEEIGKPIVAALHGHVIGAGLELALASSIRIASRDASFSLPELRHGIIPGSGGLQRLARLAGIGWTMDMILSGRPIDAERALQIGLVTRLVDRERLHEEALAVARTISKFPAFAVRAAKSVTLRDFRRELDSDIDEERRIFALCLVANAEGGTAG